MLCVLQAMFGWLGSNASGLLADEQALIDGAGMPGERSIEDQYARQSGQLILVLRAICDVTPDGCLTCNL